MALPNTNISTSLVGETLGTSSRDVGTLCTHQAINKWSKRKPIRGNLYNIPKWWRLSTLSDDIRCGFYISSSVDGIWDYMKPSGGENSPYRLGDFRGYDHETIPQIVLNFPNYFEMGKDYEASFIMTGFENAETPDNDVGAVGLQDVFDIQNKYCCIAVRLQSSLQEIIRYSNRILYTPNVPLFGINLVIPSDDLIQLLGQGGTILMEIYLIEADSFDGNVFYNPKKFSIRAFEDLITRQYNSQFLKSGYIVYSNFDSQQPTKSGSTVNSTGFEKIAFSSDMGTGGAVNDYYFKARIIGNQLGSDYIYNIPNFNLAPNETRLIDIPNFSLSVLDTSKDVILEYSVWQGVDIILSKTYNL